ncbi:nucleoside-diphosphate kinase [Streptomyces lancefieldiae]|uniref:nucleoside-diphosphate kinase n=1 Tax=Streptomyces lancefieldiae TaxID=3075520 RepID=UPI00288A8A06|nr:nucleoside-diphosphate kinase [Streptomyces sp. DSM 40712]
MLARDLHAQEGWAALAGALGDEEEAYAFSARTALMWLRPDAFAAGTARRVVAATAEAGFTPLAVRPIRLERCAVRALWSYMCRWATAERLILMDALVALGPGLLVLWADDTGGPVSVRMMAVKGRNDPARREPGSLRDIAGSPSRALTMLHTTDDPADVVRELAVLCSWPERAGLIAEAAARLREGHSADLDQALGGVERELPPLGLPVLEAGAPAPAVHELFTGPVDKRWAALVAASEGWPLLRRTPGPAAWPEQETRSPWQ